VSQSRAGTTYGVVAYALWGLFPLYWPLLEPAKPLEVLAHRVLWSFVALVLLLAVTRGFAAVRAVPRRQVVRLSIAAALLAVNWGTYIYGVNSGQVVETSLGYFINPLVSIALAVAVLGERLRTAQKAAVAIAALAVVVLTVEAGKPPVIALVLAFSFGTYGLLKKQANTGAVASLTVETAALAPVALVFVIALALGGSSTFGSHGVDHSLLLASAGLVTTLPLLAFGAAATRIPLATLGILQYLAPTIQLFVGLFVRHEEFGTPQLLGFSLVWVALLVFSTDLARQRRTVLVPV
jgi:chloramphenicol-sensitive protein RarD